MSIGLMEKIVKKAKEEGITDIYLYNWTEPLIHPRVGDFIDLIQSAGLRAGISSNLNISKNLDQAVIANPSFFRISLSGYSQSTYALNHVGGDIEVVKKNMLRIAELRDLKNTSTNFQVYYHRYLDNIDDEAKMRQYAEGLSFRFQADFAYMMPLEKTLAVAEGKPLLTDSDLRLINRLALPPIPDVLEITKRHKHMPCSLKGITTLDSAGNVVLCCTVFDQSQLKVCNYLELPLPMIQEKKNISPACASMCERCVSNGLHVYSQHPNLGELHRYSVRRSINFSEKRLQHMLDFDEAAYLEAHPDVLAAKNKGLFGSGLEHYVYFGKSEGRRLSC